MAKELTIEELKEKLAEAEKKAAEAETKAAEAETKAAEAETKAAEAETKLSEFKSEQSANTSREHIDGPDELTRRIIANEKERAAEKRKLFIPEDLDPDSPNTWDCEINGKRYLVPKGKEVTVPLAVYEMYNAQVSAERKARAELRKAQSKVEKANTAEA